MQIGGQELVLEREVVDGRVPDILGMNFMHEYKVRADVGTGEMQLGQETT